MRVGLKEFNKSTIAHTFKIITERMVGGTFYEGERISYDRELCTVRWVGEVANTKGSWLGVEWDDTTRGKHAGEHEGVRYFKCQYCPRGGASSMC